MTDATRILEWVAAERVRQHQRWDQIHEWGWGDCSSSLVSLPIKLAVLNEECGELARAVLEREPHRRIVEEAVQVAAVAAAIAEWAATAGGVRSL